MATKVIALDAGHGLRTSGKQTPNGIKEWSLNDAVRDKVVARLKDYDVKFVFPDNNEGITDESLANRRAMYVSKGVDAMVSIHHNANTGNWNSATGVEVFTDRNPIAKDKTLANCIYPRLVKYTGLKGRGIKEEDWYVINQDKIPAVLVEGGFMDGSKDYKVITSEAGKDAYARAVAEGLIEFLGLKKKTATTTSATTSTNKTTATTGSKVPFKVRVDITNLCVRKGPGTNYAKTGKHTGRGVFTITETKSGKGSTAGWGKLKSGAGWISLDYAKRV